MTNASRREKQEGNVKFKRENSEIQRGKIKGIIMHTSISEGTGKYLLLMLFVLEYNLDNF